MTTPQYRGSSLSLLLGKMEQLYRRCRVHSIILSGGKRFADRSCVTSAAPFSPTCNVPFRHLWHQCSSPPLHPSKCGRCPLWLRPRFAAAADDDDHFRFADRPSFRRYLALQSFLSVPLLRHLQFDDAATAADRRTAAVAAAAGPLSLIHRARNQKPPADADGGRTFAAFFG